MHDLKPHLRLRVARAVRPTVLLQGFAEVEGVAGVAREVEQVLVAMMSEAAAAG